MIPGTGRGIQGRMDVWGRHWIRCLRWGSVYSWEINFLLKPLMSEEEKEK